MVYLLTRKRERVEWVGDPEEILERPREELIEEEFKNSKRRE